MQPTISNQRGADNTQQANNPRWITWGNGRRLSHDWAAVHAMMLNHGYAFIRVGNNLVGFPADTEEGRA